MDSGTGSFLVKLEAILDVFVYDWESVFFLLSVIQFGHKQSFDEKRKPYVCVLFVSGDG